MLDIAITKLQELIQGDMAKVNNLMLALVQSHENALIGEILDHIINGGGKKLRPMLCLASAKMFGSSERGAIYLAAAIESLHAATLLHDDVIDGSTTRRKRPTSNSLWGENASILVGDFLFSHSFRLMVDAGSLEIMAILTDVVKVIAAGEVRQLTQIDHMDLQLPYYLQLINAKTAELFGATMAVGAMIAGADASEVSAIRSYGQELGMCFQITDDILDYTATEDELGKAVGSDFGEGKVTAPLILSFQSCSLTQKQEMTDLLKRRTDPQSFEAMKQLVHDCHGFTASHQLAYQYCLLGQEHLKALPDGPIRRLLGDLLQCIANRSLS